MLSGHAYAGVTHPHPTFEKLDTLEDCAVAYMTMEWKEGMWRGKMELLNRNEQGLRMAQADGLLTSEESFFDYQHDVLQARIDIYKQTAQDYFQHCLLNLEAEEDRQILGSLYFQFNTTKDRVLTSNHFLGDDYSRSSTLETPNSPLANSLNHYLLMLWNDGMFRGQLELLNLREEAFRALETYRSQNQTPTTLIGFDHMHNRLVGFIETFGSLMESNEDMAKYRLQKNRDLQRYSAIVEKLNEVKQKAIDFNPNIGTEKL